MNRTLLALLVAFPIATLAAQTQSVTVPRFVEQATIDGVLDELVWQQAVRLDGFRQYQPADGRPAEDSTVVLLWYAPEAIHIGIIAYDRQPGSIRATLTDRDNIDNDDRVVIYIDTFNDRRRAYFFGVNPFGIQEDGLRAEGGYSAQRDMMAGLLDRSPDFLWESKGQRTDDGWVAEIRIPFKSLRWAGGEVQTWGFNVQRETRRTGYTDTWTDVRRANASFLAQAGTITGIRDIQRGVVTELQPTMVVDYPGALGDAGFSRDDPKPEFGANLRLGFTNFAVDATLNPDFSQVESDVGLVTINERFALFFPERRPFFLEGIDLFASPNNLVYTRTVANPLAGGKVTGKAGPWSLAHLSAIDEFGASPGADADTKALVNITRVRRDLGESSVGGITLTNRDESGAANRVLSADARIVFKKLYYFQAQIAGSHTIDSSSAGSRTDPLWQLEIDRTGRRFGFHYTFLAVGDDFETWSGFVNRPGIMSATIYNRWRFYGARGDVIEEFSINPRTTRYWNYGSLGDPAIEGTDGLVFSASLRGGWSVRSEVGLGFVRFHEADYAGYEVTTDGVDRAPFDAQSGVFDSKTASLTVTTPTWQQWNASLGYAGGETAIYQEASEGRSQRWTGSVSLRPNSSIRANASLTYQRITRAVDGVEFARTILPRLKVEYQPSRALFIRVVGEYRSQRQDALRDTAGRALVVGGEPSELTPSDRLRLDWLASFEPTAGTVAFIGYGSTLRGNRPLTFRELERTDDAFFLKLSYLFRW
jgi:hypothetical protein